MNALYRSPMLAPNKLIGIDLPMDELQYPYLLSIKYNGVRGLTINNVWVSRSGKVIRMCKEVQRKFKHILALAHKKQLVLDGEFHSDSHNTVGETVSILAGKISIPDDFQFKCFYCIPYSLWNTDIAIMSQLISIPLKLNRYYPVKQIVLQNKIQLAQLIDSNKTKGIEGFMLLCDQIPYKHGRVSLKDKTFLKFKYYNDPEDGKIIGLTIRRKCKSGVSKALTTFGYTEQYHKKEDFEETDIAGGLRVRLESGEIITTPFPLGYNLKDRQICLSSFNSGDKYDLNNRWICFRRLTCEESNKPVCIKQVEIRDDKD